MSFEIRDCTSPVRVRVKKASDRRCRCRNTEARRSCITRWPTWLESSVWITPSTPVAIAIAIIPPALIESEEVSFRAIASRTRLSRKAGRTPSPAVITVIGSQVVLASVSRVEHWTLLTLPWWVWLISVPPELALLIPLAWDRPRHRLEQLGLRRMVALALIGVISLTNALLLVALIGSLVKGKETSGAQLLLKAVTVWATNVIAFGLWYWAVDRGGPVKRLRPDPPPTDFQFPPSENPKLAEPGWYLQLI